MRTLAILLLFAGCALPILAEKITVKQLDQALTAKHDLQDAQLAQMLSELELTERLSEGRLAQLVGSLPGTASRQALALLADTSAILDVPADELPVRPHPTMRLRST
jgi:hypothetical protein